MRTAYRDLLVSLAFGLLCLLLFHLDHLIASYSGWDDPAWLLHLFVDSSYIFLYGGLFWLALRGWRVWQEERQTGAGRNIQTGERGNGERLG